MAAGGRTIDEEPERIDVIADQSLSETSEPEADESVSEVEVLDQLAARVIRGLCRRIAGDGRERLSRKQGPDDTGSLDHVDTRPCRDASAGVRRHIDQAHVGEALQSFADGRARHGPGVCEQIEAQPLRGGESTTDHPLQQSLVREATEELRAQLLFHEARRHRLPFSSN